MKATRLLGTMILLGGVGGWGGFASQAQGVAIDQSRLEDRWQEPMYINNVAIQRRDFGQAIDSGVTGFVKGDQIHLHYVANFSGGKYLDYQPDQVLIMTRDIPGVRLENIGFAKYQANNQLVGDAVLLIETTVEKQFLVNFSLAGDGIAQGPANQTITFVPTEEPTAPTDETTESSASPSDTTDEILESSTMTTETSEEITEATTATLESTDLSDGSSTTQPDNEVSSTAATSDSSETATTVESTSSTSGDSLLSGTDGSENQVDSTSQIAEKESVVIATTRNRLDEKKTAGTKTNQSQQNPVKAKVLPKTGDRLANGWVLSGMLIMIAALLVGKGRVK